MAIVVNRPDSVTECHPKHGEFAGRKPAVSRLGMRLSTHRTVSREAAKGSAAMLWDLEWSRSGMF